MDPEKKQKKLGFVLGLLHYSNYSLMSIFSVLHAASKVVTSWKLLIHLVLSNQKSKTQRYSVYSYRD